MGGQRGRGGIRPEQLPGCPVRDADGEVFGTVCALHESARQYSAEEQAALEAFRQKVEALLAGSPR
ncbi:GAF domain-containing protein [Pseudomonas chlororaphis]|uniref:GAF domain-containing protein n=1 Tax=Pseudomonas chlororaphis TaxID=587753 RepID=UPI001F14F96E|nr:GAF domain-containing protein [Pseudomonas chlororaphis]